MWLKTFEILSTCVLTIMFMVKPPKDKVYSDPCIDTCNQWQDTLHEKLGIWHRRGLKPKVRETDLYWMLLQGQVMKSDKAATVITFSWVYGLQFLSYSNYSFNLPSCFPEITSTWESEKRKLKWMGMSVRRSSRRASCWLRLNKLILKHTLTLCPGFIHAPCSLINNS